MTLETNLTTAFQLVGTKIKDLIPPEIDNFATGWVSSGYPATTISDFIGLAGSTVHCAVSCGPETPTLAGQLFEQTATNTADVNVPAGGWSGTNWDFERASSASTPPTFGNNIGRLEVTPFADFPDPTFGTIAGVEDLSISSIRRNAAITINNLTIGNRYYLCLFFFAYPDSLTRATIITTPTSGLSDTFGVDGTGFMANNGIRRYGWTATATSEEFIKASYDNNGSYLSGFLALDLGV